MKKSLIISTMAVGCLALALGLVLAPKVHAAPPNASQTAQDVMVKTVLDNSVFQISGTTTFTFDKDCAESNYTASAGVWNGIPATCSGSAANCAEANRPDTPPAPAPPDTGPDSIKNHAQADHCTYYCGGTLLSWNYTQTQTVKGKNNTNGNWTFTYNYSTSPNTATVAAGTCWSCEETGGTVDVGFTGFVSSESFLKQSNGRTKYSFTLLDSLGVSRVLGATAQLQKFNGTTWDNVGDPIAFTDPLPVTSTTADYLYFGNVGVFGNSAVFNQLHATGGGKPATNVSAILLEDNFVNNDNDLANGNVHEADYSGSFTLTQDGSFRITISGSVKDNAGTGAEVFSVSSNDIIIGGCDECDPPPLTCSTPTPTPEPIP
jgi:hypothetical protein